MKSSSFGYLIKEGARNIYANRMMSIASIGTLVACLLLIGSAVLFSLDVNNVVGVMEPKMKWWPFSTTKSPIRRLKR